MHDKWRDSLKQLFWNIFPLVKLIHSPTTVRDEQQGLVRTDRNKKAFHGVEGFVIEICKDGYQKIRALIPSTGGERETNTQALDLTTTNAQEQETLRNGLQRLKNVLTNKTDTIGKPIPELP